MLTNAKVAIELYVDDKGTLRIKQFSSDAEQSFKKVEKAGTGAADRIKKGWETVKGAWVGIVAGIMAMRKAWDMMNVAAKARQEKRSFAALAASYGSNSKKIINSLKEASQGTVDTMTLIRNAGTAMMMGIRAEDTVALMKVATATTKMTGQTTVQAFEDITLAVGRQSKLILDNLGILVDVEKANKAYAREMDIVGRALTDVEKKQAFMNATLAAGADLTDKMGNQTNTAAAKFERFVATTQNIKNALGDVLIRVFNLVEGTLYKLGSATWVPIAAFYTLVQGAGLLTDALHLTAGAAELWGQRSENAFATFNEMSAKGDQAFRDMLVSSEAIISGQANYRKKIQETTKAIEEQEKAEKKILALHKKEADEKTKVQEEMYKELGIGADKYFSDEASDLVKKAALWQEAGADTLAVEEWLYDQLGKLSEQAWEKQEETAGLAMDSLQAQSRTLVDEFTSTTQESIDKLDAVGLKIDGLDGSEFTIYAALDGSGMESTVDTLIAKFQQLSSVASAAMSSSDGYQSYDQPSSSNKSQTGMFSNEEMQGYRVYTGNKTTISVNQKVSRSDIVNIASDLNRSAARQ